jgi:uncharacterized membrane protein YeiH
MAVILSPREPPVGATVQLFLSVLDMIGTFVFALSGATLGVRKQLDLFGVLVLSFAAAVSGGIARDLLIGAIPPVAFAQWHYLALACLAGLVTFFRYNDVERLRNPVQVFDAIGLALFAVTGTAKALAAGMGPVGAMLLGMLTGIGGGIARDILVARVPVVLQSELYAVAALAGAAVVVAGNRLQLPGAPVLVAGALLCFGLRFMAIRHRWRLPVARHRGE